MVLWEQLKMFDLIRDFHDFHGNVVHHFTQVHGLGFGVLAQCIRLFNAGSDMT
jgi:hypothetical protein